MRTFLRIIPVTIALVVGLGQISLAATDPKVEINNHFTKAIQYSKAKKWNLAVKEYQAVIKLQPGSVPAYTNLGGVYMAMRQANNAEIAFKQVIKAEPKNERVLEQLTSALVTQGKGREALTYARRLMGIKPKEERYVGLFGSINLSMKEYAAAADIFRSMIHTNPKNEQAYVSLGYCYMNMTPPAYVDALETMELLLKVNPKNVQARMTAAWCAEKSKDKTTAITHYEVASTGNAATQALLNLARLYREMQQPEKSVNALKRILKVDKNNFDANFNLGAYEYGKSNWKAAENYWLAARKSQPSEATVNLNLSMVMARQNRFKEALRPAEVAFAAQPRNPSVLEGYGYILECNSQQEKALDVYEQLEKVNPKSSAANEKMGVVYAALARKAANERAGTAKEKEFNLKSCGQYALALTKNPGNADVMGEYGDALVAAQALEKAEAQYQAAVKLKPDSEVLLMKYSNYLKDYKKPDKALELLQKSAAKYPKNETMQMLLAQEYGDQKKNDKAIEIYNKVVEMNPKSESALRSLAAIYTEEKKYDELVVTTEKLAKIDPKNTYYSMALADALDKKGDTAAALAKYQELAKSDVVGLKMGALQRIGVIQAKSNKPDEAIATYKSVLDVQPGNAEVLELLSRVYDSTKKTDEFLAYLKSMIDANKPDAPYRYIMKAYTAAGKTSDAIPMFEAIYAKSPGNAETASILASAYASTNQKDKAIPIYTKIIATFAEDQIANKELGLIYRGLGEKTKAFDCLRISAKQRTLSTDQMLDYGKLCEELGKTTDAKNAYMEYLKYNPADKEISKKVSEMESAAPASEPVKAPIPYSGVPSAK